MKEIDMEIERLKSNQGWGNVRAGTVEQIRLLRIKLVECEAFPFDHGDTLLEHAFRNRLNSIMLATSIAQIHLERGDCERAAIALQQARSLSDEFNENGLTIREQHIAKETVQRNYDRSVLLVEDDPNERHLLTELLQIHGIRVRLAKNGIEAIEKLEVSLPDAILMNMQMPYSDGPSTVYRIRGEQRFSNVPIFAVTGLAAEARKRLTISTLGVNRWFQKPIESEALIQAIGHIANNKTTNF